MNSVELLESLISFYGKCANLGAVKIVRDPQKTLIQITALPNQYRYHTLPMPLNIGKVCFIFPKKAVKVYKRLLVIRPHQDDSYIGIRYLRRGKVIEITCTNIDGKIIHKYKFKAATINF